MIRGYKAFYKGLVNKNGFQFEEWKTYSTEGKIKYGQNGNGFHFCERIEDTLRYFSLEDEELDFAEVTGLGNIDEYHDHYNGFFNMYCTDKLRIDKVLSREDIISIFINMDGYHNPRLIRFIMLYPLTNEELALFKEKFSKEKEVMDAIHYYQEKKKDTYEKQYIK